mmetsp:Transcript_20474/g.33041  ORF Transcript_20474/g.33041 Transcript_20474/m.33041 type:complete len:223 (-) Transcript_20474:149-817(-)
MLLRRALAQRSLSKQCLRLGRLSRSRKCYLTKLGPSPRKSSSCCSPSWHPIHDTSLLRPNNSTALHELDHRYSPLCTGTAPKLEEHRFQLCVVCRGEGQTVSALRYPESRKAAALSDHGAEGNNTQAPPRTCLDLAEAANQLREASGENLNHTRQRTLPREAHSRASRKEGSSRTSHRGRSARCPLSHILRSPSQLTAGETPLPLCGDLLKCRNSNGNSKRC